VIAIYFCLCRKPEDEINLKAGKWAMISAFIISILQMAVRYSEMFNMGWEYISKVYYAFPLAEYSLAWVPVSIVIFGLIRLTEMDTVAQAERV